MSYILDALKKSEQERKKGKVPGLNSFQDQPRPARFTSHIFFYPLLGTLLIIGLAISMRFLFRQGPTPPPTGITKQVTSETALLQIATPLEVAGDDAVPLAETSSPAKLGVQATTPEPETLNSSLENISKGAETKLDEVPQPLPTVAVDSTNEEELSDNQESSVPIKPQLITFAKLPEDIRSSLPELVIAAHYYASSPSARMASINGRIMRQGQTVSDGLVLEEIIQDGVVFSFQRYRFSLKVFNR